MKIARIALMAVLFFSMIHSAQATLLYDINSNAQGTNFGQAFSGDWGFQFQTTTSTVVVNALGLWDEGANGLIGSHEVGLWDISTGGQPIVSALVSSSSVAVPSAASAGDWLFTNLPSPVTLNASSTYEMAYFDGTTPSVEDEMRGGATATFVSGSSYVESASKANGTGFLDPPLDGNNTEGYFGPNLDTSVVGVPEPSSVALLALGAAGLLGYGLKRGR